MRRKFTLMLTGLCAAAAFCSLCAGAQEAQAPVIPSAHVLPTAQEIRIDGKLEESAWTQALAYPLSLLDSAEKLPELTRAAIRNDRYEDGTVKFLLGGGYLYVGIAFTDRDIVAQGKEDQTMLFSSGDVAEVFLKPEDAPGYFELYVSPLGNRSSFFFPAGGYLGLPECTKELALPQMQAAASVDGTLNDSRDEDKGWTAELAIPLTSLQDKTGVSFSRENRWRLLVARYNYGRQLRSRQYASFPLLPQINYHLLEYYAPVTFTK